MTATLQGGRMMTQLPFSNIHLSKEAKRRTEKIMSRYRALGAVIESKIIQAQQSVTQNYNISESQRVESVSSPTETAVLARQEIEDYKTLKRQLDLVYKSLNFNQQRIWDGRYVMGRKDVDVYTELGVSDNTYYNEKKDMVIIVAVALGLED